MNSTSWPFGMFSPCQQCDPILMEATDKIKLTKSAKKIFRILPFTLENHLGSVLHFVLHWRKSIMLSGKQGIIDFLKGKTNSNS